MSRKNHIITLEKRYARMKGEYFAIEKEAENYSGSELIDKWKEIENRQKKIITKMNALENVIKFDEPHWDGDKVKSIRPHKNHGLRGALSESVYEFIWSTSEPFSSHDAYSAVKERLKNRGIEAPTNDYLRNAVINFLRRLDGSIIDEISGTPTRWKTIE